MSIKASTLCYMHCSLCKFLQTDTLLSWVYLGTCTHIVLTIKHFVCNTTCDKLDIFILLFNCNVLYHEKCSNHLYEHLVGWRALPSQCNTAATTGYLEKHLICITSTAHQQFITYNGKEVYYGFLYTFKALFLVV